MDNFASNRYCLNMWAGYAIVSTLYLTHCYLLAFGIRNIICIGKIANASI